MEALDEIDFEDLDGYAVHQINESNFILRHPNAGKKEFEIKMKQTYGLTTFEGLPSQMQVHTSKFSQEEV